MTERPILFSGPMVRAILAGRKRQTRRVIKPQPESPRGVYDVWPEDTVVEPFSDGTHWGFRWSKQQHGKIACDFRDSSGLKWKCPYGQPGDVLWVKETWTELLHTSPSSDKPLLCDGDKLIEHATRREDGRWNYDGRVIAYRATSNVEFCDGDGFSGEWANKADMPRWRSPLFMPRWASRLSLVIKSVRVERVQDIGDADAWAEGVQDFVDSGPTSGDGTVRGEFAALWDSINGKTYPWASNPWVWCLSFERIDNAR